MLAELVAALRPALGILHKRDIQTAASQLGRYVPTAATGEPIRLGDDTAAIPDGDGYLLLAAEGIWPTLVQEDPWFAGWCAVLVNVSDIYAMGGATDRRRRCPVDGVGSTGRTTLARHGGRSDYLQRAHRRRPHQLPQSLRSALGSDLGPSDAPDHQLRGPTGGCPRAGDKFAGAIAP